MLIAYPVLIRRNIAGAIIGFCCPDLAVELTFPNQEQTENIPDIIKQTLCNHIEELQQQKFPVPTPKKLSHYKDYPIENQDIWSKAYIEVDLMQGFFEKALPKFGLFSSIMTALTMAIIYFTAIELTTGSTMGAALGVLGALSSTLMSVIIYYHSDAGKVSRKIGKKIDDGISELPNIESYFKNPANQLCLNCSSTAKVLSKLAITALPVAATTTLSLSHYQSVNSMGDKLSEDGILSPDFYHVISLTMIVFSLYSTFTFQMSFLPPLYQLVDRLLGYCTNRVSSRELASPSNEENIEEDSDLLAVLTTEPASELEENPQHLSVSKYG